MPSGNLIAGNVYHKGLAWLYSRAMAGIETDEEERNDTMSSFWDSEIDRQLLTDETGISVDVEEIVWGKYKPENMKKRVMTMVDVYAKKCMPLYRPLSVEQKFTKELSNGVMLIGWVDLEAEKRSALNPDATPYSVIVDHKWRGKAAADVVLANDFQSTTYTMLTGIPNIEFHEVVNQNMMKMTPRKVYRSPSDCEWCEAMYIEAWQLIQNGIFPPNPQNFLCKPEYCSYYSVCRLGW